MARADPFIAEVAFSICVNLRQSVASTFAGVSDDSLADGKKSDDVVYAGSLSACLGAHAHDQFVTRLEVPVRSEIPGPGEDRFRQGKWIGDNEKTDMSWLGKRSDLRRLFERSCLAEGFPQFVLV